VALGGRIVVSEHGGFRMCIGEQDEVVFVRYGFVTPNQPRGDELPGWHQQAASSVLVDASGYSLVRVTM
jgi:hypothetical protein